MANLKQAKILKSEKKSIYEARINDLELKLQRANDKLKVYENIDLTPYLDSLSRSKISIYQKEVLKSIWPQLSDPNIKLHKLCSGEIDKKYNLSKPEILANDKVKEMIAFEKSGAYKEILEYRNVTVLKVSKKFRFYSKP